MGRDGGGAWLEIENPSPDLEPEDLASLTEPFWRKDDARTSSEQGGLGLSLADELARHVGLDLTFRLQEGQFAVRIAFPP